MSQTFTSQTKEELLNLKSLCKEAGTSTSEIDTELKRRELEELRDKREEESLIISRKALDVSEKARLDAERANKIAISAIVLSIATAIGIAIFQWLTKK